MKKLILAFLMLSTTSNAAMHAIDLRGIEDLIRCNYLNERVVLHKVFLNPSERGISIQLVASTNGVTSAIGERTLPHWAYFSYADPELLQSYPTLLKLLDMEVNNPRDESAIAEFINRTLLARVRNDFSQCAAEHHRWEPRPR